MIQLCKLLKIRTVNLVADDDGFERTKELLVNLGATHVLATMRLAELLDALGSGLFPASRSTPSAATPAVGWRSRCAGRVARAPFPLVGAVPELSPSLVMFQQVSLYAFNSRSG